MRATSFRLGIVSTYLPRRCGLATYTADLREALDEGADDLDPLVVAIDRDGLAYGDEVIATINQDQISDYERVAGDIRAAGVDVVLIQHEYGIFGGPNGSYVLHLARALTELDIPYVVTLHTLLSRPTAGQAATLAALCAGAARVTVFTETARRMAIRTGVAAGHQIVVVPHGAPEVMRADVPRDQVRPELADLLDRLDGDPVLTTFGLVSAGKGLEDAIAALADVVRDFPRTHYVIAGATHPEIVRREGESYREGLHTRVEQLGLTGNVHFVDSFLSPAELSALLKRTTIFITPYRSPEQICSGALTFGVAAGCPVVSTSYQYAEDVLRDGAGILVPCRDQHALAAGVRKLLDDPTSLGAARAAADAKGAGLIWPAVALTTAGLFRDVVRQARTDGTGRLAPAPVPVPPLKLDHLVRLCDEIGLIEFCQGREPDLRYGYNVDDVARLGIVAAQLLSLGRAGDTAQHWVRLTARFLKAAARPGGRMHNRMSYSGSWTDEPHVGDHVGRAVWALGALAATPAVPAEVRRTAATLLEELTPHTPALREVGLRSCAYALLGLVRAEQAGPQAALLVEHLDTALRETADPGWYWFEPELTYDNARLPHALLAGAGVLDDRAVAARALTALDWFADHTALTTGTLRNVGNHWHHRDHPDGWADDGDEQPIDAAATVEALVEAWWYTGEPRYAGLAGSAYAWFGGRNWVGVAMYEESFGGCHDGLLPTRANPNFGAESTLAHQQAMLSLLRAGLATLPDRLPVERPAVDRIGTKRAAATTAERGGTVRAPSGTPRAASPFGPDHIPDPSRRPHHGRSPGSPHRTIRSATESPQDP